MANETKTRFAVIDNLTTTTVRSSWQNIQKLETPKSLPVGKWEKLNAMLHTALNQGNGCEAKCGYLDRQSVKTTDM